MRTSCFAAVLGTLIASIAFADPPLRSGGVSDVEQILADLRQLKLDLVKATDVEKSLLITDLTIEEDIALKLQQNEQRIATLSTQLTNLTNGLIKLQQAGESLTVSVDNVQKTQAELLKVIVDTDTRQEGIKRRQEEEILPAIAAMNRKHKALARKFADAEVRREKMAGDVEALADVVTDTNARQDELLNRLVEQAGVQQDTNARQEKILRAISQSDSQGNYVLNVKGNVDNSREFKQQFGDAVNESMQQTGVVLVTNNMSAGYYLRVNGRDWYIAAGKQRTIEVPVGPLTTELVGHEAEKTWTIGPPNYRQGIEINPRRETLSPTREVYPSVAGPPMMWSEPVYVSPPSYVVDVTPMVPIVVWP